MSRIRRALTVLICAAAMLSMLAANVLALNPDSELTVTQVYPLMLEIEESISLEDAEKTVAPEETCARVEGTISALESLDASVEEILVVGSGALAVGEEAPFSAVVLPEDAASVGVCWSSSDEAVASVRADGVVLARTQGQAVICAAAQDGSGVSGTLAVNVYVPAAESVENVPEKLTLGVGETAQVRWSVLPEHAPQEASFKTSNRNVATVTADGKIKAVKVGSCTVTVQTPNGKYKKCAVTVKRAPGALELNAQSVRLGMDAVSGAWEGFVLRPRISSDTATTFRFASSDEGVARVSADGEITPVGPGSASVTVTTHNGLRAECAVEVCAAPEAVWILDALRVSVGDVIVPEIVLLPEGAASALRYRSGNENVMTVAENGAITGVAPGAATLTVETFNGRTASKRVSVLPAPTKLTAVRDEVTIGIGEKLAIESWIEPAAAQSRLQYSTSQKKNVTVDASGVITGVRAGTATITISTYNGKKDTVKVTVKKAPDGVKISERELRLGWDGARKIGEVFRLSAKLSSGSAGGCEFTSSDPWVAYVDARTGEVRARGIGTAQITATAYNGRSASCSVEVLDAPKGIRAEKDEITLGVGQKCAFETRLEGGVSAIKYVSGDETVATVSESGEILAQKRGVVTVTAETFNGHRAEMTVEVLNAPSKLALAQSSGTVGVGGQFQIVPVLPESAAASFSYSSSNSKVATVDGNGVVTGVKPGSATITVKTHNGKKNTFTIKVVKAPDRIALSRGEMDMQPGEELVIKASLPSGSAANIEFASSDEAVAIVDGTGRVTAISLGECVITATTHNGLAAECRVHVIEGPAFIRVPADMMIGTGELARPEIEVLMASGEPYEGEYTLTSSNSGVASVKGDAIKGGKRGMTTITVRSHTITAQFNVEVVSYGTLYPTKVFAHRGASAYAVDNTLEAFRMAEEMGADGVELDVRRSKDGVLVVFHDASLDVNGVRRNIADMTLEELKAIDLGGSEIPTLDEALEYIKSTEMSVQVELKAEDIGADCADAVRRKGLSGRAIYISFSLAALSEVKQEDSSARLGYVFSTLSFNVETLAQQYDLYVLLPRYAIVNEKLVTMAHNAGLKVGTWTVNDAENLSALSMMDVDFIATDRPDLARKFID